MCGRMTLTRIDLEQLADALEAEVDDAVREAVARPRFNVAPTQPHPIVVGPGALVPGQGPRARVVFATWGLPTLARVLPMVRAETAATKFASAWAGTRAVVPADGFYEWSGTGAARRASWLTSANEGPLLIAGLWRAVGPEVRFAVITVPAGEDVAPIHDRMPALLSPAAAKAWLGRADATLLAPAPAGTLRARRVSPRVNSVVHDDAACLEPDDGRGQLALL